jgi:hypothetical protein
MMELLLQRETSTDKSTPGVLYIDGVRECFTLEDVVREQPLVPIAQWKIPGQTAIPAATYGVIIDASQRFGRLMPHVIDLPGQNFLNQAEALSNSIAGFVGIRIHPGNTAADTEGCILLGRVRNGWDTILQSQLAFGQFYGKLKIAVDAGEPITLEIVAAVPVPTSGVA